MAVDVAALKTELTTDPSQLGYAADITAGSQGALVTKLNQVRPTITVKNGSVSAKDIVGAISMADLSPAPGNLTATQLSTERRQLAWLALLPAMGQVRLQNDDNSLTPIAANLDAMFPASASSATRARIITLMTRNGSRAEQLFGPGVSVTGDDVYAALNS